MRERTSFKYDKSEVYGGSVSSSKTPCYSVLSSFIGYLLLIIDPKKMTRMCQSESLRSTVNLHADTDTEKGVITVFFISNSENFLRKKNILNGIKTECINDI